MKETFYFSHDYNARNDPKIKKMMSVHGIAGYGIFWAIVEDLYQNANALPTDYDCIAYDLRTDSETVKSIINDFGLFVIDGENVKSESIEKRINERNTKTTKAKESAIARWGKIRNANAMRTQYDCNAIKEKKVKEKKGKEKNINMKTTSSSLSSTITYSENENRTEEAAADEIQNQNSNTDNEFDPEQINDQTKEESRQKYIKRLQTEYKTIVKDKNQIQMWKEVCPDLDILAEMKTLYAAAISRDQSSWVTDFRKFIYYSIQKSQAAIFSQKNSPPGLISHAANVQKTAVPLSPYGRILSQEEIDMLDAQMIKI